MNPKRKVQLTNFHAVSLLPWNHLHHQRSLMTAWKNKAEWINIKDKSLV